MTAVDDLAGVRPEADGGQRAIAEQGGAPDLTTTAGKLAELKRRLDAAQHAGSERAIERHHARGKLTARERVELLLDPGTFVETDALVRHRHLDAGAATKRPYGDGVVTGFGTIDGRQVCLYSQDYTVMGGSLGEVAAEKMGKVIDLAIATGSPFISINDSAGARIQEGVVSLAAYITVGERFEKASGVIPQFTLNLGTCAGGAVYAAMASDFLIMVDKTSHMFVTGPEVIKSVLGEDVSLEDLGGARVNATRAGTTHYVAADEKDALDWVKVALSYLPSNNREDPPKYDFPQITEVTARDRELDSIIPDSTDQPYDMHKVLERILDDGEFLESQSLFAPNIICGLGRVEGRTVGVVANQPMHLAGTIDIDAAEKSARFIRTCDAFNIPILTVVDVPGFLPGTAQEWNGIIRRGAKLAYAYSEASVPMITIVTRKWYGGGYIMGCKQLNADAVLAWPTAQIAVVGAAGAINLLARKELEAADDPAALRAELVAQYEELLCHPYLAAERGYVDAVIEPSQTRLSVARALRAAEGKRLPQVQRKHGNIPC